MTEMYIWVSSTKNGVSLILSPRQSGNQVQYAQKEIKVSHRVCKRADHMIHDHFCDHSWAKEFHAARLNPGRKTAINQPDPPWVGLGTEGLISHRQKYCLIG